MFEYDCMNRMYMIFFDLARLYLYTFYANYKKIVKAASRFKDPAGKEGKNFPLNKAAFL